MSGELKKDIPLIPQQPEAGNLAGKKDLFAFSLEWAPVAILLFTALLYSRAVFNGFTSFDDDAYILDNPLIKDFSWNGIKAIFTSFSVGNYHPFTLLIYLFEYTCFGLEPLSYHLTNVLLHIVNTWLVFRFAEQLSGKRVAAIVVSLLFAIHPMHAESVAWVSETKDVLYAMFYLLSLLCYMRYLSSGLRPKYYIGALLLFFASLFSKSAAVTLPVLLIAIDIYKGRIINARSLLEKIPFLLLSLLFGIVNIYAQQADKAFTDLSQTYNIFNRIVLVASSLGFYFLKLIAPFNLSAMHFFPRLHGHMLPGQYYTSLPFILFIVILLLLARRSPFRKEIYFGTAFFLITISVMLQIVAVGSMLTAERYTYIPYIGLFYIIGQWVANINVEKQKPVVVGVISLIVVIFSLQTWARIGVWNNDSTLYTDVREKEPKISRDMAYGFLLRADAGKASGNFSNAIKDYNQALLLYPGYYEALCNRGYVYKVLGDIPSALSDFNKAISLHPEFADAYNSRGAVYYAMNDLKSAISDFSKAVLLKPAYMEAYINRGAVYFEMHEIESAIADYNKAIELKPDRAMSYNYRGWAHYTQGDTASAIADYSMAISLDPGLAIAYNNRGWAYAQMGAAKAAMNDYNKVISFDPNNALAYHNLAAIKANLGDLNGSLADYNSFLNLQPNDNAGYYERATVYLNLKNTAAACADLKKAQELGNTAAAQALDKYCH